MKKTVIAIWGISNAGKTSTIKGFYEQLKSKYPAIKEQDKPNFERVDIQKILDLNGIKIGIESEGDPSCRLFESLPIFLENRCDIIVCATRSKGSTVDEVNKLASSGYEIKWIHKVKDGDLTNAKTIESLFNIFENVLNGEYWEAQRGLSSLYLTLYNFIV